MNERHSLPAEKLRIIAFLLILFSLLPLAASCRRYKQLSEESINDATARNQYESDTQREIVEYALSLVGRVHYFWGGKYNQKGENPKWGEPTKVVSTGHSTTGETLPLGLDCSGYVSWCFAQATTVEWMSEHIGEGTWNQWFNTAEIEKDELKLGDLAFANAYPGPKSNHIGIIVGFLKNGEPLVAHCAPGPNNVVVTTLGSEFNYFRRADEYKNETA